LRRIIPHGGGLSRHITLPEICTTSVRRISPVSSHHLRRAHPVDGEENDLFLGRSFWFSPVKVDRRLKDGGVISLRETQLKGRKRTVLIVNTSVIMPLVGNYKYPEIADDLSRSFEKQRRLSPDIWVAAHAS
jgi:hypothetical protein